MEKEYKLPGRVLPGSVHKSHTKPNTVEQISVADQQLFKAKMALRYIPPLGHAAERICERYSNLRGTHWISF